MNCTYHSPYGAIVSNWKKITTDHYIYEIKVPIGTRANITLPLSQSQLVEIINEQELNQSIVMDGLQTGQFFLQEGNYVISVTSDEE